MPAVGPWLRRLESSRIERMSTVESREQLIQQRQAEKYINVIRLILLGTLTLALVASSRVRDPWIAPWEVWWILALAWSYSLGIHFILGRGFFPRYLPWVATIADLGFLALGFGVELAASQTVADLGWGYSVAFLLIVFSTLRERPGLTILTGVAGLGLYLVFLSLVPGPRWGAGFEVLFRCVLLLLTCFFSSFHARSVRKAFLRAATSDRLRRETDSRLKVLALHFPGVLFQAEVHGKEFSLLYVSEGCRELLGIDSRDLMARPQRFFDRTPTDFLRSLAPHLDQDVEYRTWEQEFSYGEAGRWLKLIVTSYRNPAGVLILNGLVTDVSEQRRAAEALREANQAKTDFLATMSHELRTPLNAILGNAEHLSHLAILDDDKRAFRDLQVSGETLLGLIEDILVFSRLEAGRLSAEVRPVAWRPTLEGLLESFRVQATDKGLHLGCLWPDVGPETIGTDALRLRQIVGNLVSNAIKFTPSGRITVEVAFEGYEDSPWLCLRVRDTGIGVPVQHQEKIFEKFTQGEHGKSRTYGGLGLGLSISRSLAELLGGTLTIESTVGQGSVFILRIPVSTPEGGVTTEPGGRPAPGGEESVKVLVVEDNLTNQDVATRMLKRLGAQVDVAPGGREALALVEKNYYDVIFMDWQMPVMDGRETTERIRALPQGRDLVIVALSGHALPGDRELLLASGFDDYLSKPVRMEDFRVTLSRWVSSRDPG